jgi:drug/metabolite transporter (DMT)-like permease
MSAAAPSLAPGRGVACVIGGSALLTLNDAVMKWLTADYPVGEVLSLRAIAIFIPTLFLVWRAGGLRTLRVYNVRGQAVRAVLVVGTSTLFLIGLSLLPLADAVALTFAGPLFIVAMAGLFLGEPVGWRRWLAVSAGFVGVLMMLQPGTDTLRLAAFIPLCAAFFGALRDIVTRHISISESSVAVLFYSALAVALAGLLTLPFGWRVLTSTDLMLVILAGILQGSAHYLYIEAFRLAQAALVAPYKYSQLIWAFVFGFFFWGYIPNIWIVLGSLLVVGSGLYSLHRDTRRNRS